MPTKAYNRFANRIAYYDTDIELCDLLVSGFFRTPHSQENLAVALGSAADRYPNLARRINTRTSKSICGNHLKATLHGAFIKDLFEDFSAFISDTMTKAALAGIDPARFVGEIKLDLHAADILATGNWDSAVRLVSDAIFRRLENERNTKELLRKASARLGLAIDQNVLDTAMPYLDARHILVHRDGRVDALYIADYPQIAIREGKLVTNSEFVRDARRTVDALAKHIDDRVIAANLVRNQDMGGRR